ncbi:MAG TPA: YCF48-related protein [Pyrinomonadaceae bacterium]|jgi:photosystem II stability/assembly factor-like uncharacterized protein
MNALQKISILLLCLACFQTARAGWVRQNANTLAWLHDVYFSDENHGFIAGSGGTFLETRNGGNTWTKRKNFTADKILQIYFTDAFKGWLLCERDPFSRGAQSISYLMKTTDGGENWERVEFKDAGRTRLTKIFFNQKGKGFAIGESGAFFELDDGGNWGKSPSPVRYLLLDGAFFSDTSGAVVGAGGSAYFTEDAGASWNASNVFAGGGAGKLTAVFFADRKNGWAVGSQGKILQTASGGKTWREQRSGVGADLLGVFFKDASEGWAVGDEGVILHTSTGGNSWVLEDASVKHRLEKVIFVGKKGFAVGFGGTIMIYGENNSKNQFAVKPVLQRRN